MSAADRALLFGTMNPCLSAAVLGVALVAAAPAAHADPADTVRRFAESEAAATLAPQGLRAEISVGRVNPNPRLALCRRSAAFLPPGGRLWGRSVVGLRCLEGADWSFTVPVHVRVFGPALVAGRPLAANQPIDSAALLEAEVDLTRHTQALVSEPAELEGRVLGRAIAAGQPILQSALRAPQVVAAGDMVRVEGLGHGFSLTLSGQALSAAQDGQTVRVRTEAGKVVNGTARAGRVVEVAL